MCIVGWRFVRVGVGLMGGVWRRISVSVLGGGWEAGVKSIAAVMVTAHAPPPPPAHATPVSSTTPPHTNANSNVSANQAQIVTHLIHLIVLVDVLVERVRMERVCVGRGLVGWIVGGKLLLRM